MTALALALSPAIAPRAEALSVQSTAQHLTATSYCGLVWGSLPKTATSSERPGSLTGVRAGRHACYDRLVLDIRGPIAGFDVRYVDAVHADGSGAVVPVAGGARLQVMVQAPAYDAKGNPTYRPASRSRLVDVAGWRTFRQVAWAGSFEGRTTVALGVRARLPMRVFVLPGTDWTRVVIDVAHQW